MSSVWENILEERRKSSIFCSIKICLKYNVPDDEIIESLATEFAIDEADIVYIIKKIKSDPTIKEEDVFW